jgi:hypothetical protein
MTNITTGQINVGVGNGSLQSLTTGNYNVAVGQSAGFSTTTGQGNTFLGWQAGQNVGNTTGSYNIFVGYNSAGAAAGDTFEIVVGTSSIVGKGSSTAFISANGGGTYNGANTTTWATTSDQRLKKNIVDNNDGLDKLSGIKVRNFEYRLPEEVDAELKPSDAIGKEGVQLGVIAQELQKVLPDCVKEESTGVLSVQTDNLIWYAINAIKELNAKVTALEEQVLNLTVK